MKNNHFSLSTEDYLDNHYQLGLKAISNAKLVDIRIRVLNQIITIIKDHILNLQIKRDLNLIVEPDDIVTVLLENLEKVFTIKVLKKGEEAKEFGKEISSNSELYKAIINHKIFDCFSYFSRRGLKIDGIITNIKKSKVKVYAHYYNYVIDKQ